MKHRVAATPMRGWVDRSRIATSGSSSVASRFWAGLRGAVAVATALSLPPDFPQRDLLREITYGVVLFTLLVQGTTTESVIRWTGAEADAPSERSSP